MSESDLKDLKSEIFKYKGRKFKRQHQPAGLLAANKDSKFQYAPSSLY